MSLKSAKIKSIKILNLNFFSDMQYETEIEGEKLDHFFFIFALLWVYFPAYYVFINLRFILLSTFVYTDRVCVTLKR